ncbi:probable serine/threonine-protein kinase WNK6 [Chenopodium quinoa]|uniref:probable serine/threonine-protein kinase WNK6 n=1 Tax=Chenopodium quinoa TaxID=63459 RepID=UPI000B794014|nr:probable serine/threonine-protein kinase WNK6 [Chenopodium quinoa]
MASSSRNDNEIEEIANNPDELEKDPTRQFIRFNKMVGIGTLKKVYEGLDTYNGHKIAWSKMEVGQIGKHGVNKCCEEAEMMKSLNHPNIVKCYTYWYDGINTINIITDLCSSGNLREYIHKHDLFRCPAAIKSWCRQILSALHYIHSQNIIHLDVNVDNIVVNGNSGTVKLADFGFAVYKEPSNVYSTYGGRPGCRAPEVLSYEYNHLADIYSFGMTVLQMMTYEKIYSECETLAKIVEAVQSGTWPDAMKLVYDLQLRQFIERCIKPASERPEASELLRHPSLATTDEGGERSQDNMPNPKAVINSQEQTIGSILFYSIL